MDLKNYYQILDISHDASPEDIKKTFRRLALRYHPDRNPENIKEAEARFKEINEAYEVLGDEIRRRQYDRIITLLRTIPVEDDIHQNMSSESIQEMLRRFAGMGFVIRGAGWGKPWSCGRRQGGQCRRQWRQDID